MLAWNWSQGFRNVFATKGGTKPGDFSSIKLRSAPAPIWVETVKALGAAPVSLEFTEMYTGIQSKVVDGCEQNYGAIYNNAIYEVVTTMTETRHVYLANCVLISAGWFRALPEEHQAIILEECEQAGARSSDALAENDSFYLAEMEKAGMQVIPYADVDIAAFKAKAEEAYAALGLTDSVRQLKVELGK
jgi:TRAP-type C4-dicarboxylate transport system substrate-binding protein